MAIMLSIRTSALLLAGASFFAARTSAQTTYFGPWVDTGSSTSIELYVDAVSGDDNNSGIVFDPAQPMRTLSATVAFANQLVAGGLAVTINVFPGTYGVGNGEIFPIAFPDRGLTIEALGVEPGAGNRALLTPQGFQFAPGTRSATLLVDTFGAPTLPPSVIRGLEILTDGAANAVRIDPANPLPGTMESAVEVRDCFIHGLGGQPAVEVTNSAGHSIPLMHEFESNVIVHDGPNGGAGKTGVRVFNTSPAPSSVMFRSNQIARFQTNLEVNPGIQSPAQREQCRPRLFSNIIQVAQNNVVLTDCNALLVNNTIAYALNLSTTINAYGLLTSVASRHVLINNLFWNPSFDQNLNFVAAESPAEAAIQIGSVGTIARDIWTNGTPVDTQLSRNNCNEDGTTWLMENGAPDLTDVRIQPRFAGSTALFANDAHPRFARLPALPNLPKDLHLSAFSLLIDAGTLAAVQDTIPPINTPAISVETLGATGISVRRDVNLDVDLDPRLGGVAMLMPDIGGDEATDGTRLRRDVGAPLPERLDTIGNLRPLALNPNNIDHRTSLLIDMPAGANRNFLVMMFMGGGFEDGLTIAEPVGGGLTRMHFVSNRSMYQSSVVNIPGVVSGQLAFDPFTPGSTTSLGFAVVPGSANILIPGGTTASFLLDPPALGLGVGGVAPAATTPIFFDEGEVFVQAIVVEFDANGNVISGRITNRLPIEYNK